MKLAEFRLFSESEQLDLLYEQGVYIGKRKEGAGTILLYQLDSFYIELFYRKHRCSITRMHFTASTDILEPYLEQINIEVYV